MLGIKYIKFDANTYVMHYKNGRIKKEGRGLSFYYYAPKSSIAAIPVGTDDVQFIFNESTADFQTISIQGQITYKVETPRQLADQLDLTVDEKGNYKKDDYEKLNQRLINEAQTATSAFIQSLSLKEAIRSAKTIEQQIFEGLSASKAVQLLGIEPLSINILAVKPDPKTEKALEAATREALQKEADLAIYERRNFGVEQERMIRESELNTEIAVEEKQKQIAEKKMETDILQEENQRQLREMRVEADMAIAKKNMEAEILKEENERKLREMKIAADITIEQERQQLIDMQVANRRKEAEAEGYATELMLQPYRDMDWRQLTALNPKASGANQQIALAFRELAENSDKIGNLNITPDLLQTLIESDEQSM